MVMPSKDTRQALAKTAQKAAALIRKEKKEIVLTPKNKAAVELMVFDGLKRSEAAELVGLTDHALRTALTKPHVLAYLNEQMEVLRTSGRPRALHTMIELLESKNDSTKFKAAEYLDGMNRSSHQVGATQINLQVNNTVKVTPGYVIDLTPDSDEERLQIGHLRQHGPNGLPYQADVPEDD
jgi:hypothetical protein